MRGNPINLILTGIAVADLLNMLEYIPFNIHMYLWEAEAETKVQYLTIFLVNDYKDKYQKTFSINNFSFNKFYQIKFQPTYLEFHCKHQHLFSNAIQ